MPALDAKEGRLIHSVPLVDTAANGALARCVAGIDAHQRDTGALGLVGQERSGLCEGPGVQAGSLTTASRYPGADMRQIFQRNAASGAFSGQHDHLRDAVVYVGAESPFLAGELAEATLGGLGAAPLQAGLPARQFGADALDLCAGVDRSVAIDSQGTDSEVNPKPVLGLEFLGFGNVAGGGEIPFAPDKAEIDLAFPIGHQAPLMLAHDHRDGKAAVNGPQIGRAILGEAEDMIVVGLCTIRTEDRGDFAADFESVGDLGDCADGGLGGEVEVLSEHPVSELVHIELSERPGFKPGLCQPRRRFVASREGCGQALSLSRRRQELDGGNEFHVVQYGGLLMPCQGVPRAARPAIPPSPEGGGLSRRIR